MCLSGAGSKQRFLSLVFGTDVNHVNDVDATKSVFKGKANIRRATEDVGIIHTYVASGRELKKGTEWHAGHR
ncbi:hypothetical protein OSB04_007223 [Centaurea solstitialis]|uniref:Uncharacterized protein n=1 Tax=Centaurea solstitialis TaxID=347529 RepID=A0AA38TJG1_9ASTR|nr:hypothetical protein OSB04_007223 [Centaurea solstitialis]